MATIPEVDPSAPPTAMERAMRRFVMSDVGTWIATGRKSGEPRTVPLVYYTLGEEVILIASSFGRPRHPSWYLNVKANPEVELLGGGVRRRYLARETSGAERDRLFALAEKLYAGYGLYATRTRGRIIPVLALRPVSDAAASA
ncbi:MAG TPA: nitroreductase family deazaflavin-dependent oxidoreductase [Solirubrobacterales bacterium]|jgi:deazaflavin-dependent oxidoreductase (nitroreductase family)|nr:nitroreductase family deazaflavin-dependent oxidoreductase [Solirubrobacterales bacterium]